MDIVSVEGERALMESELVELNEWLFVDGDIYLGQGLGHLEQQRLRQV